MFAVDISNFSGEITDEQATLIRDSNRKIVIGCQDVDIAIRNAATALKHCLEVELYVPFYTSIPIERELNKAQDVVRSVFKDRVPPFLWLDFEDAIPEGVSSDMVLGWADRIIRVASQEPFYWIRDTELGIYTRRSWWEQYTGSSTEFDSYKLWDANYDGVADLSAGYTPYGWKAPAMKQYRENFDLWGVNVDLNVY